MVAIFDRLRVFQRLNREWRPHLTVGEQSILSYLIDASISYGRTSVRLSLEQMLGGSRNKEGDLWLHPVGVSRNTLRQTLASLQSKGVLIVVDAAGTRSARYQIDLNWDPTMPPKLAVPKRLKAVHPGAETPVSSGSEIDPLEAPSGSKIDPHRIIEEEKKDSNRSSRTRSDCGGRVDNAVETVKAIQARKPKKADREATIAAAWKQAHVDGELGIAPALTGKDRGQLARVRDRIPAQPDFVPWVIRNWRQIIADHFGWMDRSPPPTRPAPGFMLAHANIFIEAYGQHLRSEEQLSDRDRKLRTLLETGMKLEDALLELARQQVLSEEHTKLAKEKQEVRMAFDAVARERQHVRRMAVQRPRAPEPPPPVINHGDNPFDKDEAPNIPTDFGDFDGDE